jgi:hypothetical protein
MRTGKITVTKPFRKDGKAMITLRKTRLLMVVAAACVFSAAYGRQNDNTERQLKFETAGTMKIAEEFPEIKYVADFHVVKHRDTGRWIGAIDTTSKWKQMSEKQRQFILKLQNDYKYKSIARKRGIGYPFSMNSDYVSTPEGTITYRVYGVSVDDVRKMAEAVIEWIDNNARSSLEFHKKRLQQNQETIAEAEKMLPEIEKECRQLEMQTEQKMNEYAKANYGIGTLEQNMVYDYIRKSMEELASYLRLADFELIGLQARMDSIEKFKTDRNISDPGTLIKLDQMLIADEIERAGILARKKAYETAFKQTEKLYKVMKSRDDAAIKKWKCQEKLEKAKKQKNENESVLANPPKYKQPLKVYENKVVIWQVKQD